MNTHKNREEAGRAERPLEPLLTYAEVARETRIPVGSLYALVSKNGVPHVRLGTRSVRFRRKDIEAWLAERSVEVSPERTTP